MSDICGTNENKFEDDLRGACQECDWSQAREDLKPWIAKE